MRMNIATASSGTSTAKIIESLGDTVIVITTENMSINGARTAMRMSIMNAFCTFPTSTVRRVTRPAVENLSIFANEKSCIL